MRQIDFAFFDRQTNGANAAVGEVLNQRHRADGGDEMRDSPEISVRQSVQNAIATTITVSDVEKSIIAELKATTSGRLLMRKPENKSLDRRQQHSGQIRHTAAAPGK